MSGSIQLTGVIFTDSPLYVRAVKLPAGEASREHGAAASKRILVCFSWGGKGIGREDGEKRGSGGGRGGVVMPVHCCPRYYTLIAITPSSLLHLIQRTAQASHPSDVAGNVLS